MGHEELLENAGIASEDWDECFVSKDEKIFRPLYQDGQILKTAKEIYESWEKEQSTPPPPTPMELLQEENRLLRAQITAESDRSDFIEDCIAEMAAQVYV